MKNLNLLEKTIKKLERNLKEGNDVKRYTKEVQKMLDNLSNVIYDYEDSIQMLISASEEENPLRAEKGTYKNFKKVTIEGNKSYLNGLMDIHELTIHMINSQFGIKLK